MKPAWYYSTDPHHLQGSMNQPHVISQLIFSLAIVSNSIRGSRQYVVDQRLHRWSNNRYCHTEQRPAAHL